MGRKPNQLILEFFERGQKLEDASNRYQHTCKACGENFPKGRIDSLTTHLFKKCPAIAHKDRQRAFLQLHDLPDADASHQARDGISQAPDHGPNPTRSGIGKGQTLELPIATRNWTALETLAEVSRQVDPTEWRPLAPAAAGISGDDGVRKANGRLPEKTLPLVDSSEVHPDQTPSDVSDPKPQSTSNTAALPPIQYPGLAFNSRSTSPHLPGLSLPQPLPEPLVQPAPPAVEPPSRNASEVQAVLPKPGLPLEPELARTSQDAGISDKYFHPQGPSVRTTTTWPLTRQTIQGEQSFFNGARDNPVTTGTSPARAATYPRAIAMNPHTPQRQFTSEFGSSSRSMRPKVRGRFTASRRKEVQEVRKRGACIRCRMLKKPCSGESPCNTCRNVESARLWKQPCIRTRIADELELYSGGLHAFLAYHDVAQAKGQTQFQSSSSRIQATHFCDLSIYLESASLEGTKQAQGQLLRFPNGAFPQDAAGLCLLDTDSEDLPGKVELYVRKMTQTFFERETSPFMKATLGLATELSNQKKDILLTRVLELWSVNHILVDSEMRWTMFETTAAEVLEDGRKLLEHQESYRLIRSQLRSATEKRAGQLSKSVMNELERRLLQRAQSGWFETFLVAVCLLNCVERCSWLFQTWDCEEHSPRWPLDRRPPYFYQQGERFADMLQTLLKMRGLPPKIRTRPGDGILATDSDETARRYFDSIQLSNQLVEERQNAQFDANDSRSLELKFCSKLLGST